MNRRPIFTSAALRLDLAKSCVCFLSVALLGLGFGSTAAYSLEGTKSPANIAPAVGGIAPKGRDREAFEEAFRAFDGSVNLRASFVLRQLGDIEAARKLLEGAARNGDVGAAWELGRMYADGDGVTQNHQLAFEYFGGIADAHADEPTDTVQAHFIANAFVRLGGYYLTGIPNSNVKPDALHARDMFNYAASYYGDRDAQYRLGRMYLDGQGGGKDTKQGIRWLSLAANKEQYQAQAVFGALLFKGQYVLRDAARGLMWLMLARKIATPEETWITDQYTAAWEQATPDERTRALDLLKRRIEQSRSGRRGQS
jgi:exopolysaccharide production negative regulator